MSKKIEPKGVDPDHHFNPDPNHRPPLLPYGIPGKLIKDGAVVVVYRFTIYSGFIYYNVQKKKIESSYPE